MFRFNPVQWFEDLKTKSKLLTAFGMVSLIIIFMSSLGVWTTERLRQQAEAIYVDYTVPLIDFNTLLLNVGKYNTALQDLAKETHASDFRAAAGQLDVYKKGVETTIVSYEATLLRVSSTGRDESKDLVELKASLDNYFSQAESGIAALAESFESKILSASQAQQMHELGQQALTVGISPAYNQIIYRHGEQIKTLEAVAKDLSEEATQLARQGILALIIGGHRVLGGAQNGTRFEPSRTCCAVGGKWQLPGPRKGQVEGRTRTDGHIVQYYVGSYHGVGNFGI
jgi:twitching motility protein PilJ